MSMQKNMTKPQHASTENDEYYYRHPEMYRAELEEVVIETDNETRK